MKDCTIIVRVDNGLEGLSTAWESWKANLKGFNSAQKTILHSPSLSRAEVIKACGDITVSTCDSSTGDTCDYSVSCEGSGKFLVLSTKLIALEPVEISSRAFKAGFFAVDNGDRIEQYDKEFISEGYADATTTQRLVKSQVPRPNENLYWGGNTSFLRKLFVKYGDVRENNPEWCLVDFLTEVAIHAVCHKEKLHFSSLEDSGFTVIDSPKRAALKLAAVLRDNSNSYA